MNDDLLRYVAECERAALVRQACLNPPNDDCYDEDLDIEPDEFEELDHDW